MKKNIDIKQFLADTETLKYPELAKKYHYEFPFSADIFQYLKENNLFEIMIDQEPNEPLTGYFLVRKGIGYEVFTYYKGRFKCSEKYHVRLEDAVMDKVSRMIGDYRGSLRYLGIGA